MLEDAKNDDKAKQKLQRRKGGGGWIDDGLLQLDNVGVAAVAVDLPGVNEHVKKKVSHGFATLAALKSHKDNVRGKKIIFKKTLTWCLEVNHKQKYLGGEVTWIKKGE